MFTPDPDSVLVELFTLNGWEAAIIIGMTTAGFIPQPVYSVLWWDRLARDYKELYAVSPNRLRRPSPNRAVAMQARMY